MGVLGGGVKKAPKKSRRKIRLLGEIDLGGFYLEFKGDLNFKFLKFLTHKKKGTKEWFGDSDFWERGQI